MRVCAVRLLLDHEGEHPSRCAVIMSIGAKIGCTAQTLSEWVMNANGRLRPQVGVTTDMAAKPKTLERENRNSAEGYSVDFMLIFVGRGPPIAKRR